MWFSTIILNKILAIYVIKVIDTSLKGVLTSDQGNTLRKQLNALSKHMFKHFNYFVFLFRPVRGGMKTFKNGGH